MSELNHNNITKKDISKRIVKKTGLSFSYANKIVDDLLYILRNLIKEKNLNIKNFATFKTIKKGERLGRNPKTGKEYKISSRKTLSFSLSKKLSIKFRNLQ